MQGMLIWQRSTGVELHNPLNTTDCDSAGQV
jgi:hypothetical protein